MGTMLDLNALRQQGHMGLDICASNSYLIGHVDVFMRQEDHLFVSTYFYPQANVELTDISVYVHTDCSGLTNPAAGVSYQPGDSIPVGDAASALLYMPMTVNYDPANLEAYSHYIADGYLQHQMELWQSNIGCTPEEPEAPASNGGSTDWSGWNWASEEPVYGEEASEESPGESWTEWTWNAEEPASGEEIPEENAGEGWTEWNWEEPEEGSAEGVETMQMTGF